MRRASLRELQSAVHEVKALLRGVDVVRDDTTLRLAYADRVAVPVYVAGASDRTHRMSGEVADGALVAGAVDELATSVAAIRAGERDAGRPDRSTQVALFTTACLDENEAAAREAVRPVVARKAINSLGRRARLGTLDPSDQEPLDRLRDAYDTHHHMEARYNELVPDRWVDRFSVAGSPGRVLDRCRQAASDGADQVAVVFAGEDPEAQMRAFADAVIAPMKRTAQA